MMKRLFLLPIVLLFTFFNAQEYIMQNGSVTTCSGTFYDSGGANDRYSSNENYVYTICPDRSSDPELATVLDFTYMNTQINVDIINVYDGDDTTAPLIATLSGGTGAVVSASDFGTNVSGCLTVEFISDIAGQGQGWEATISCQVPCQKITPTVTTIPAMNVDGNVEILETETVDFSSTTTFSQDGTGATYEWDFGDGNTATGENATNTYPTAGTYTTTLTVTDPDGCSEVYTFLVIVSYNTNVPCPSVSPRDVYTETEDDVTVNCTYPLDADGCIRLEANFVEIRGTESYVVQSIPFQPPFSVDEYIGGVDITQDDVWSSVIGFPQAQGDTPAYRFCFFGNEEDDLVVGANGRISFDTTRANNFDQWAFTQTLPTNNADMLNNIFGAYHDINIAADDTGDAIFSYGFSGDYPCRAFVVNYNDIPLFSCSDLRTTQQIVLWESSNYIDVYIHNKPACPNWNSGSSLIGLQGTSQNQWIVAPGRNTANWSAQDEAWRFIPDGAPLPVTIRWYDEDGNEVGQGDEVNVCPREDTFYTVEVTYELCGQDPLIVTDDIHINFDFEEPDVEDRVYALCDSDGDGELTWDLETEAQLAIAGNTDWVIEGYYTEFRGADQKDTSYLIATPSAYIAGESSVFIRVEAPNGCYSIVEIVLDIADGLVIDPLLDTQCLSPNATEATYDLNTFTQQIPSDQIIDVYYYLTQADAEAGGTNYLQGTDLSEFTITETTVVYIRVVADDGCFGLSELTLEVSSAPFDYEFNDPVQFCDVAPLGDEVVDLTTFEDDIANGETGVTFLYFENYQDALDNNSAAAIVDPTQYLLTTSVTELFLLVQDENGCYKVITMPISLLDGLELQEQTIPLCDVDNDNSEEWDLTSVNEDIIANSTDYTFTYYPSQQDLDDGTNEITDPTTFIAGETTVYVLVSNADDCSSTTTITLELNDVPVVNPAELSLCPDENGELIFDLTEAEGDLLNGQTGITLTYHNTQAEAEVGDNPITDVSNYTGTDGEIVYVNMVLGDCSIVSQITLNASDVPTATQPDNIVVCDADSSGNEEVDLTSTETTIIGAQTGVVVTYHLSQEDADTGDNAEQTPTAYLANVGTTTIYVRVENDSECFATTMFDVIVNSGPTLIEQTIPLCDVDNDDSEEWDLTSVNEDIIANSTDYTFTYYPSQQDLDDGTNEITNPTTFTSGETTVYVLVSNADDCSTITTITLELSDVPVINPAELSECPDENGELIFDLTEAESDLLNGQTGITLTYHNTQAEAEVGDNPITDVSNYTGNDGEIVYVNMVLGDCSIVSQITLNASDVPTATQPDNIVVCDADASGNEEVDLTSTETTIIGAQTGVVVTYHLSEVDANTGDNAEQTPTAYLANVGTTTIYVRVENDSECFATTMFDVIVNSGPTLTPQSITLCDEGDDGSEVFDLTSMNDAISGGATGHTYEYYESVSDIDTNNPITSDVSNYTSTGQIIYVLVDDGNNCPSYTELELIVKTLPVVTDNQWTVCDPNFDGVYGFNLSDLNDLVVANTSNYSFEVYATLADAQNMTNPMTQTDANNITTVPSSVYVRVTDISGEPLCSNIAEVELTQGDQTQVNTTFDTVYACDEGNGMATFDFSNLSVTTETGNTEISFHTTMENAENNTAPLTTESALLNTSIVYVRVTAEGKCPSITQFNVEVIARPVAEITAPNFSLCVNDTIILTADQYNPAYEYAWTNQTGTVLGNGETLNVNSVDGDQEITLTVTNSAASTSCQSIATQEIDVISTASIVDLDVDGTTITVTATGQGPFEYSLDGINWQISNVITVPEAGYYDVYVRSFNLGCEGIGAATLVLDINNVITPNGDGVNDVFVIPFMDVFKDENGSVQASTFNIYDRFGKVVHSDVSSDSKVQFTWNGLFQGRILPSGDYWYLLKLADGRQLTGHITVKNQ